MGWRLAAGGWRLEVALGQCRRKSGVTHENRLKRVGVKQASSLQPPAPCLQPKRTPEVRALVEPRCGVL